jgi:hypothetical protein
MRIRGAIVRSIVSGAVASLLVAWACALWSSTKERDEWYDGDGPIPRSAPVVPAEWFIAKQPGGRIGGGYSSYEGFGFLYRERRVGEPDLPPIRGWVAQHALLMWDAGWPMHALECRARFDEYRANPLPVRWGIEAPPATPAVPR